MPNIPVVHPTKEEYEIMDRIRFPFLINKEKQIKETVCKKFEEIKKVEFGKYKDRNKLEERIKRLIAENKERFFDPRIGEEIKPIATRNKGGWANNV